MITDAPWYVLNAVLQHDLHNPSVKEEIQHLSSQYSARLNSYQSPDSLPKETANKQTFETPPANRSAHQISSIILGCIPSFKFRCKHIPQITPGT
jgi:hypothetical protein